MRRLSAVALLCITIFAGLVSTAFAEEPRFTLTKLVNPASSGEIGAQPLPGSDGKYSSGTIVTLTAYPAAGYAFAHWSAGSLGTNNTIGSDNPRHILVNENKTITANFVLSNVEPRYTLTKTVNPQGYGEIGLEPPPGQDGKYSSGTLVTLTAYPAAGKLFSYWSGALTGSQNPRQLLMNNNKSVTANFATEQPRFTLTKIVNPQGSGEIGVQPPPGTDGKYSSGTIVTLTAYPAQGYGFSGWNTGSNSALISQNPIQITIREDRTVTGYFVQLEGTPRFSLTTEVNPNGSGHVALSPLPGSDGKYSSGTIVRMTAQPAPGYFFFGWSGGGSGPQPAVINTENPRHVHMLENLSFIAYFEPQQEPPRFSLAKSVNPPGSGEISVQPLPGSDGKYTSGTIVTLTAHPAAGFTFHSWSGSASGNQNPKQILMNENKSVTANFASQNTTVRFTLTKGVTPAGAGEIGLQPPPGLDGKYTSGTIVTATAHAFSGYSFSHWAGASNSTSNPIQVKMTENKSITAVFETVAAHSADVMIHLALSHNPVIVHTPYIMTVHVANHGPSEATNAYFEVHLPAGVTYTSSTISQGAVGLLASGALLGNLGSLPAGGHAVAGLILVPHTTGTLECHASVDAEQPDPYLPNNQAHIAVRVLSQFVASPDLAGSPGTLTRRVLSTGSKIAGNFIFSNDGALPSRKCVVHYYLSADDMLDPSDQLVRTQGLGALRSGRAVSKKFSLKLPSNAEGQHIIGVLDPNEANLENNEVNNTIVSPPVP
ncbi:MAG: InlB B-repeat-containing protein [Candidatus Sumerlaeaceae bacterium]